MKPHIHTITELAIFTAIAFIFSYIESLFPLPIPFPGIKLGLANLVIVLVLYKNGFCQALTVSIVRGLLNAFTFGSLFGFLYSLLPAHSSLTVRAAMPRLSPDISQHAYQTAYAPFKPNKSG